MLSRRTAWDLHGNALAGRLEAARASGRPILDLTESNPARCGLGWDPAALSALLHDDRVAAYEPTPRGLLEARAAVSGWLSDRGAAASPGSILLTASTSEAFGWLFQLLCDPGDEVLVPAPAYPLLDLLADLAAVRLVRYPLRWDGEWHVDLAALAAAVTGRTRAVVAVSPSNPTGAVLSAGELGALDLLCASRGLALVGDEVFADTAPGAPSVLGARECLAFSLAGLSKTCGLPQVKAGWIAAAGPARLAGPALERLEVIADTALSVSATAQLALPRLLARREAFLGPLRARLAANRAALAELLAGSAASPLRGAGGWSAVVRVGETVDEEALCLDLLERDGVAVQPGFFYDFARKGHLVVSLLSPPQAFRDGVSRLAARLALG
ncbi:MAG TPA: pyridoxal phosphate-dependent aminotransferase [Anaeromyxobacteraceae bacterium]|nr:pyridoxal phosphate-dependent aminotransferase [Anaeromyxobacteraceae bacterium]